MENIVEGNKLIAEFMGTFESCDNGGEQRLMFNGAPIRTWRVNKCKYSTSWDWLMPVVEKIESMYGVYFDIYREASIVKYQPEDFKVWSVTEYDQENKINHVYNAVINFINLYNTQNN